MTDRDLLPELLPKAPPSELKTAPPSPELLLQAFLAGRNPSTLRAYRKDLEDFQVYVGAKTTPEAIAHLLAQGPGAANALVLGYRAHLKDERQLSPATVNRRLAALRSMVKLARQLGLVAYHLEVEDLPAQSYRDTQGPGRQGVLEMLSQLKGRRDEKAVRDRAIVRLLYDLALRRLEVVSLRYEDVDLRAPAIWVLGKGRTQRQKMTLAPETRDALAAWLKLRGQEPGPLFHSLDNATRGHPLTDSGLYVMIRQLGEKAGLRVRPHGLRHAAITDALDATSGDVRAVQRFSRHKDLNVLCVYDDARRDLAGEVTRLVARRT